MVKTLAFALVVVSSGEVQQDRTTYYAKLEACRWFAQMIGRRQKYYHPVEDAYCEAVHIDTDKIKPITVRVIPKKVPEQAEGE
jgi:hypothetical protein